jgi:hypothetical protein
MLLLWVATHVVCAIIFVSLKKLTMKKLIAAIILSFPLSLYAQNVEIMLGGGASLNSSPTTNMAYSGEKICFTNYAAQLGFLYNFAEDWQAGLQGTVLQLSRISDKVYAGPDGTPIGGSGKHYVYSNEDATVYAIINRKMNIGNGYFYGGLAAGYGIARNNSKSLPDNVAYEAPDGGKGYAAGAQIGYVIGINSRLGIYAEGAFRYMDLKYDAEAPNVHPHTDLHYQIMAFPLTVGLRYRFINSRTQNDIPAFRGRGRSR